MQEAAAGAGILQEDQEAYDMAHLEYLDDDKAKEFGISSEEPADTEDDSWMNIPVPAWSKHYKEGAKVFGDLTDKQCWWWCVKWQPTGYKGKAPKAEDMELRRMLDGVRSLKNFTE